MAFPTNGVVTAPPIFPLDYGLLAVVKPEDSSNEDRWIRGFSQEWDTSIYSAKQWDDTDTTSHTIASDATPTYYTEIKPFFIEVEEVRSTLGFMGLDRMARLKRQVEGITQKALEDELWVGAIRKGESHANLALSSSTATVLNGGTALNVARALALLDYRIGSDSSCGERGVIHMTRDVAALLSSTYMLYHKEDGRIETVSGTPVIVGSGYTGLGPTSDGSETPSATNKWIYGTGTVKVYLGDIDVVNDNLSQAYNVSGNQNDMRLKAIRPAAVYFDASVHLAVRVDLSLSV
jgi:hypothetical protein